MTLVVKSDWPIENKKYSMVQIQQKHPFNPIQKLCHSSSGSQHLDGSDRFNVQQRGCAYPCGYLYSANVFVFLCYHFLKFLSVLQLAGLRVQILFVFFSFNSFGLVVSEKDDLFGVRIYLRTAQYCSLFCDSFTFLSFNCGTFLSFYADML